jgi:hypothetical protein
MVHGQKKREPISQTLRAPRFLIRKETSNWPVAKHYRWYGTTRITIQQAFGQLFDNVILIMLGTR